MRKLWFKTNPALFEQMKVEVNSIYPNLHFYPQGDSVFIRGSFPIIHEGRVLDRYSVEIRLFPDYPESIPIVKEVGGRIPWTADRHMLKDGGACLFLPAERWKVYPPDSRLIDFLKGPVHNFFLGQSLVERSQPWPFGEWEHGVEALHRYYTDLLGKNDTFIILKYLEYLSKPKLKGHWDCPCGSKKRLRNCHFKELIDLRTKIPPHIAEQSWKILGMETLSRLKRNKTS
jgi:hypothetical protein